MLGKCGIVPAEDVETIKAGLNKVLERIREGIEFSVSDEDIHMNIEKNLIEEIGPVGGKLHTGRAVTIKWLRICICICVTAWWR